MVQQTPLQTDLVCCCCFVFRVVCVVNVAMAAAQGPHVKGHWVDGWFACVIQRRGLR